MINSYYHYSILLSKYALTSYLNRGTCNFELYFHSLEYKKYNLTSRKTKLSKNKIDVYKYIYNTINNIPKL